MIVDSTTEALALSKKRMRLWRSSPIAFVRDVFRAEPDAWQRDVLMALPNHPKIAMSACKGPGKSCLMAWCGWWMLACHKDSKGIATSVTADNLKDGLWTELATWYAVSSWLQAAFSFNAERIASRERQKTWWLSARSFPQDADKTQQANTLAGLHNEKGVVFALLDELGDYPMGVLDAAEGIFSNYGKAWLVGAGNPTQPDGPLHRISYDDPTYYVVRITGDPDDPKRSPRINIDHARRLIERFGIDSAVVRVNILGLEPLVGSNRLLGVVEVQLAMERDMPALAWQTDAIIWGIDPAYTGMDESCLMRRQGIIARPPLVWSGLDGPKLAVEIAKQYLLAEKKGNEPDAIFIDRGGVGASCYDHLKLLGFSDRVFGVDFGGSPSDDRFGDKSSEMWWEMADWVKQPTSCLPNDQRLKEQLTKRDLDYRMKGKRAVMQVKSKIQMRKEGVESPDRADGLCLTFHSPVAAMHRTVQELETENMVRRTDRCETDYPLYSR